MPGGRLRGDFRQFTRDDWISAVDANMLTPIELIKATIDPMIANGFGRVVNITSAAVKSPIDILGLSNGARSGLTGFIAGLARKTGHPQCDDQQSVAGRIRHGSSAQEFRRGFQKHGQTSRRRHCGAYREHTGRAFWDRLGVRAGLRVPV